MMNFPQFIFINSLDPQRQQTAHYIWEPVKYYYISGIPIQSRLFYWTYSWIDQYGHREE